MGYYKANNSINTAEPFIHVNCSIEAVIAGRVKLHAQNFQFDEALEDGSIRFIARAYENGFNNSKKGLALEFSKDIQSGTYSPTGSNSPFKSFYYFESATDGQSSLFYEYNAEVGTINVEVVENSAEKLRYAISFDVTGKDQRLEELHISGETELNVFKRPA